MNLLQYMCNCKCKVNSLMSKRLTITWTGNCTINFVNEKSSFGITKKLCTHSHVCLHKEAFLENIYFF